MQSCLLYVLAIHTTINCVHGRSIRVKRQESGNSVNVDVWNSMWYQMLPHFSTTPEDLRNWQDGDQSNYTVVSDSSTVPSIRPNSIFEHDVVVGSVTEEESMDEAISSQNKTEILQECKKIRSKYLRDICIRVATNPMLQKMGGVRAYAATQPSYTTTRGFAVNGPSLKQLICKGKRGCPAYTANHFSGVRSLSPWILCHEFDPNRFPQWLNKAECLCEGCIDAKSGKEDIRNVFSQPLAVDIAVLRKDSAVVDFRQCTRQTCRESVETISIGCHCALASVVSVS